MSLSSYSTELWALIAAFSDAEGPCCIVTDCQTLAKQTYFLLTQGFIPTWWKHQSWWLWFHNLVEKRKQYYHQPLYIQWSPAHLADDMPEDHITEAFASKHGTTRMNIIRNKIVDRASKEQASKQLDLERLRLEEKSVQECQVWLAQLSADLTSHMPSVPPPPEKPPDAVLTLESPMNAFEYVYPRWMWHPVVEEFTWSPTLDVTQEDEEYQLQLVEYEVIEGKGGIKSGGKKVKKSSYRVVKVSPGESWCVLVRVVVGWCVIRPPARNGDFQSAEWLLVDMQQLL
eukprot:Skav227746  [mRNA]  locus=scaffold3513:463033:465318:- [translate_table: standard]